MTIDEIYAVLKETPFPLSDVCLLAGMRRKSVDTLLLKFENAGLLLWEETRTIYTKRGKKREVFVGALEAQP